ncbi:FabD/lysophospholipase-like protein [Obba rivulosa]|uniref:Lysophospholipase n=1 Tax=Obba rivulosa TaxID=1052685 RepID=A0A8E2J627_9APHY|nr:FabD/lysophospholipase-like protein [Obba rivulosa]
MTLLHTGLRFRTSSATSVLCQHNRSVKLSSSYTTARWTAQLAPPSTTLKWALLFTSCAACTVWTLHAGSRRTMHADASSDSQRHRGNDNVPQDVPVPEIKIADATHESGSNWRGLAFLKYSESVQAISDAISSWSWPSTPDFSELQTRFNALLLELGLGPGSLYSDLVNGPPDLDVNPECEWDAEVRLGDDLCLAERAFLQSRRKVMHSAFANFIGVPVSEVDERDVPVVAIAGSGGGYRAMLNTLGGLSAAHRLGFLDCVTYLAGVSGSCWALGVMYSGVAGSNDPEDAAMHVKDRIQTSYLDTVTFDALINPPTNKYLLSGILRKAAGPAGMVSLVDVYGTFIASRLFVPTNAPSLDPRNLSLHHFRANVDTGRLPLPIFCAIQHATPPDQVQALKDIRKEKDSGVAAFERKGELEREERHLEEQTRFLWYEFTPYEIGCDEIGAWIPSWALGRRFENGRNLERRPEISFAILVGIFGSAFCASLKHYFTEIRPTLQALPAQLFQWLVDIITENEADLGLMHPVLPDQLPNFLKGLDGQLRSGSPPDITERDSLTFMDAGAELNIPYYPLLRRDVDCIVALDASADSQDLWFTRAEELAARRGLRTWPRGAGWPTKVQPVEETLTPSKRAITSPPSSSAEAANVKLARTQESTLTKQTGRRESTEQRSVPEGPSETQPRSPLSACEVWIGSSKAHELASSRLDDLDEDALLHRDGLGVVYLPLMPNDKVAPGFDPFVVSTWRREVTAAESDQLLTVAAANFTESREKLTRLLRAIWLRKKFEREGKANEERLRRFRRRIREHFQL